MAIPLILQIDVDNKGQIKINQFNQSLNNIGDNINKSQKHFSHLGKIMGGVVGTVFSLKGAFIGLGLGVLAKEVLAVGTRFEQLQIALDTITKGKGIETFNALNLWALRMPGNTEKAIQSFVQMRAMGLKPTIDQMTILMDTTSAFGGSMDIMMSIATALGKIQAKGEISARELLQLTSAGVPALEILREELNNQSIAWDNISDSSYSASQLIDALFSGMEKRYGGLSEKIQKSWFGIMETLISEWKEFWRLVLMEAGVLGKLEEMGQKVIGIIDRLRATGALQSWANIIGDKLVKSLQFVESIIVGIVNHWEQWKRAFELLLIPIKAFIAYQLAAVIFEIGDAVYTATKNIQGMKTALIALNAIAKKMSLSSKAGLVGLALWGGYEFGSWLQEKFAIVHQIGIGLMGGLHKVFVHVGDLIKDAIWGIQVTFLTMFSSLRTKMNDFLEFLENAYRGMASTKMGKWAGLDANIMFPRFGHNVFKDQIDELNREREQRKADKINALAEIDEYYTEMMAESMLISGYEPAKPSTKKTAAREYTTPELPTETTKTKEAWNDVLDVFGYMKDQIGTDFGPGGKVDEALSRTVFKFGDAWDQMTFNMADTFVDGFAGMLTGGIRSFKEFTNALKNIFVTTMAKMGSEALIRPLAEGLFGSLRTGLFSGVMGGMGSLKGIGEKVGGFLSSGPGLALVGGGVALAGIYNKFFKKKKKQTYSIPVELDFSVDEADFSTLLDDTFAKIPGKLAGIADKVKSQVGQMYGLDYLYKYDPQAEIQKFLFQLQGTISQISIQLLSAPRKVVEMNLEEIKSWYPQYSEELLNQIKELEDRLAYIREYQPFTYLFTHLDLEAQIAALNDQLAAGVEDLIDKVQVFGQTFSEVIGNAFMDSLGDFDLFKSKVSSGLYEAFRDAFLNAINEAIMQETFKKVWDVYGIGGFDELAAGVVSGTKSKEDVVGIIQDMTEVMESVRPIYEEMANALGFLDNTLRENTDAVISNTDVLTAQQQIENFIASLTTGSLAPVVSESAITGRYNELLGGGDLSELFSYISGTMLPFFQSYGGDYQSVFSGVVSDLRGLSGAYSTGLTPSAIGDAVATALAPIILNGQPIHVTVEVDGKEIGEVLIDQLESNPELVQAVQQV